jgi:hypothetical protein
LIEIEPGLTPQEEAMAGLDDHTHIVIQSLLRVHVPRVELAHPLVCHDLSPPTHRFSVVGKPLVEAQHPLSHLGQPEDMVNVAIYLVSDESGGTDSIFPFDGGRTAQ